MSNLEQYIYSTYDAGNVAIFDNYVYKKMMSTFNRVPNRSCKESDISDIQGVQFFKDDNNSSTANVHKYWTSIEMAISNLSQFTSRVWTDMSNINSLFTIVTGGSTGQLLDKNVKFKAAADGIIRVMIYTNYGNNQRILQIYRQNKWKTICL